MQLTQEEYNEFRKAQEEKDLREALTIAKSFGIKSVNLNAKEAAKFINYSPRAFVKDLVATGKICYVKLNPENKSVRPVYYILELLKYTKENLVPKQNCMYEAGLELYKREQLQKEKQKNKMKRNSIKKGLDKKTS